MTAAFGRRIDHIGAMIVSASFRTDIPAFYGDWFRNRFRAGHAMVRNPYGGKDYAVSLRRGVDGFVFWTRNARPFLPMLHEVRGAGYPFVVQYTITGYPRALETSVVAPDKAIETVRAIAAEFGPKSVVWRYDPIVATTPTPADWHAGNFARLADSLAGLVDECCTSFATIYRKTVRNMDVAARAHGFAWKDPAPERKRALLERLRDLAAERGMALSLCSQEELLVDGVAAAKCVDAERLAAIGGRPFKAKTKGNRPGCLCAESRDIGDYDTCPHGCVYCYAVGSRTQAKRRHAAHDPQGEFLFPAGS